MIVLGTTVVIPRANLNGSRTQEVTSFLPAGTTSVQVEVERCSAATPTTWADAAKTLRAAFEQSMDDGATWTLVLAFSAIGGVWVLKDGTESTHNRFIVPVQPGARVRVRLDIINGPIRTQVSATFYGD